MGKQNPETGPWKFSLFRIVRNFKQLLNFSPEPNVFPKLSFRQRILDRTMLAWLLVRKTEFGHTQPCLNGPGASNRCVSG